MVQTPEQQMYLTKLMGYDYCIEYCSGNTNLLVNALSRNLKTFVGTLLLLLLPCLIFLEELNKHIS